MHQESELVSCLSLLAAELRETATHCIAYRSCAQRPDQELTMAPSWKGTHRVLETERSIYYRAPALLWHVRLIGTLARQEVELLASTGDSVLNLDPNLIEQTLSRLGWAFDDLIFNSVSLLDYLAKFVCSVAITSNKPNQWDWSGLNKSHNIAQIDHPLLRTVLTEEHGYWFKPLQILRSQVIHNKAEVGRCMLSHVRTAGHPQLHAEFYMPEKAVNDLPLLEIGEQVDLIDGSGAIALQTLKIVRKVLNTLKQLELVCLHDPLSSDGWLDPIPDASQRLI